MKTIKFEHVNELLGYKTFNDFEKEYDNDIFYADGDERSVIKALNDCEIDLTNHLDFYFFDNWAIALYKM
ncbi:hypothetical protein [Mammaliicoccus sciuri]|uniref:hypothetical protein n=1 Tax=Mammaliicoccus sciuri TaxID=1296 RepID=UPI002DB91B4B|nr:hypothetical protein [Mammaliicoccus sciuri]MEB6232591.1 hypothetical protein [Mammaliicoccus sciuri]